MKRIIRVLLMVLVVVFLLMCKTSLVIAGLPTNPDLKVKIKSDTTDLKSKNKVYYNVSLIDVVNIDTEKSTSFEATVSYDSSLLTNMSISGQNGWSATKNGNKILLECDSFNAEQTIATISFDVKTPVQKTTKTKISLTSVTVDILNEHNAAFEKVDSDEITIGATSGGSSSQNEIPSQTTNSVENEITSKIPRTTGNEEVIYSQGTQGESSISRNTNSNNSANTSNGSSQKLNTIEAVKDSTTSNKPIPQAGRTAVIYIVIIAIAIIGVYTFIRDKKFYD